MLIDFVIQKDNKITNIQQKVNIKCIRKMIQPLYSTPPTWPHIFVPVPDILLPCVSFNGKNMHTQ